MNITCDLHLHSRYSMATSPRLDLATLAGAAIQKGIELLAAPDFTHPVWREEMREQLEETQPGSGIYFAHGVNFMLVTEVSCIWRQGGKGRRVHLLATAPDLDAADRISASLSQFQNLESDGRPTLTISAREAFNIVRDAHLECEIIPAHVFTPWYGVFGAKSGFESLEECFGDAAEEIFAVETGLSSDPEMHWSVPDSASRSIVSFSDAHSARTMGRELTALNVSEPSYHGVMKAMRERRVVRTYEFHPEHGKYHLDGHRKCGIRMTPEESGLSEGACPKCGSQMTLGVLNRASRLAQLPQRGATLGSSGELHDPESMHPPFRHLVPLRELLSHALGVGVNTKSVDRMYESLVAHCGNELKILIEATHEEIVEVAGGVETADTILAARSGDVTLEAGYDGVYGSATPNSPRVARSRQPQLI